MGTQFATLTLNPAVDIACRARSVQPMHKIRTVTERFDAGGGGINVARVLHALGKDVVALVVAGGVTGRLIEELLDEAGARRASVPIHERTRISMNVTEEASGLEYRFVPEGPRITAHELDQVREAFHTIDADWLIASGSLPPGAPDGLYGEIAAAASARGQLFALDTSGEALRLAAGKGIELLKLSASELAYLARRDLPDRRAQEAAVNSLLRSGAARTIAASFGVGGAVLATQDGLEWMPTIPVQVVSAVGAGDSFLAGTVAGLARGGEPSDALALGSACGAAAVSGVGTAQVSRTRVDELLAQAGRARQAALVCSGQSL